MDLKDIKTNNNHNSFQVLVDADACPQKVKSIVENRCKKHMCKLIFFTDINHEIKTAYGDVVIVDQGHDSVDLAIINRIRTGDIVVTQDYGLAALVLSKKAFAIHPSGKAFTDANIDFLLMDRHLSAQSRRAGERVQRHKKRNNNDNDNFAVSFEKYFSKDA